MSEDVDNNTDTAVEKEQTIANTSNNKKSSPLDVISTDTITKIFIPVLLFICGWLWSEIKEVRDNQQHFVTQEQFQQGLQSINDNVNRRLDSLDGKVSILLASAINEKKK